MYLFYYYIAKINYIVAMNIKRLVLCKGWFGVLESASYSILTEELTITCAASNNRLHSILV